MAPSLPRSPLDSSTRLRSFSRRNWNPRSSARSPALPLAREYPSTSTWIGPYLVHPALEHIGTCNPFHLAVVKVPNMITITKPRLTSEWVQNQPLATTSRNSFGARGKVHNSQVLCHTPAVTRLKGGFEIFPEIGEARAAVDVAVTLLGARDRGRDVVRAAVDIIIGTIDRFVVLR